MGRLSKLTGSELLTIGDNSGDNGLGSAGQSGRGLRRGLKAQRRKDNNFNSLLVREERLGGYNLYIIIIG